VRNGRQPVVVRFLGRSGPGVGEGHQPISVGVAGHCGSSGCRLARFVRRGKLTSETGSTHSRAQRSCRMNATRMAKSRNWGTSVPVDIERIMEEDYDLSRRRDRCSRRDFADGYMALLRRVRVFAPEAVDAILGYQGGPGLVVAAMRSDSLTAGSA